MGKFITDVAEWLKKFDDVQWNKSLKSDAISGVLPNGSVVNFSLKTKLATSNYDMDKMPVQIIVYIEINGVRCAHWGCTTQEENAKVVRWFVQNEVLAFKAEDEAEDEVSAKTQRLFESL